MSRSSECKYFPIIWERVISTAFLAVIKIRGKNWMLFYRQFLNIFNIIIYNDHYDDVRRRGDEIKAHFFVNLKFFRLRIMNIERMNKRKFNFNQCKITLLCLYILSYSLVSCITRGKLHCEIFCRRMFKRNWFEHKMLKS